jgi:nitrate reductase cytochrome c-type subunit
MNCPNCKSDRRAVLSRSPKTSPRTHQVQSNDGGKGKEHNQKYICLKCGVKYAVKNGFSYLITRAGAP